MNKKTYTWMGLGLACAACCAPLLVPLLGGLGIAGLGGAWWMGLSIEAMACGGIILAAVVAAIIWVLRRKSAATARQTCDCGSACKSGPGVPTSGLR